MLSLFLEVILLVVLFALQRGQQLVVEVAEIVFHIRRRFERIHGNIGRKRTVKIVRNAVSFGVVFEFLATVTVLAFVLLLLLFFLGFFLLCVGNIRVDFLLAIFLETLVLFANIVVVFFVFFDLCVALAFEFCDGFFEVGSGF